MEMFDADKENYHDCKPYSLSTHIIALVVDVNVIMQTGIFALLCLLLVSLLPVEVHGRDLSFFSDCSAKGDGRTDDAPALRMCLDLLQASLAAGEPSTLHLGSGTFRISGHLGMMPTMRNFGGAIIGNGPQQTVFQISSDYSGSLLSWSEAWNADGDGPSVSNFSQHRPGAHFEGFQILGDRTSPNQQNGITLFDRNDEVIIRDVDVSHLSGSCLSIGVKKYISQAYARESSISNLRCWRTGSVDSPSISIGSTTDARSDATNEIDFFKTVVFDSGGDGLYIYNDDYGSTRKIRFFGLRIEKSGRDGLVLGRGVGGSVAQVSIYDLSIVESSGFALRLGGGAYGKPVEQITIVGGALGPGNKNSIYLGRCRAISLDLSAIDSVVQLTPNAGDSIVFLGQSSHGTKQNSK